MSQRNRPEQIASGMASHAGIIITDARRGRRWTLRELAARASISLSMLHAVEHGAPASLATYAAISAALGLEAHLDLIDPRRRAPTARAEDPVHAAMGEVLAARLAGHGFAVAIDEPYQHYQFAGRADLIAWDLATRSLLHIENRTRFPNIQESIGSYNAKRRYLPAVMAERLGVRRGFVHVTNVMVGLWSSEVLHAVRIRSETFRATCPDDDADLRRWLAGEQIATTGSTSAFVVFDPIAASSRRRDIVGLAQALAASTRPRYAGYAGATEALRRAHRA